MLIPSDHNVSGMSHIPGSLITERLDPVAAADRPNIPFGHPARSFRR